MRPRTRSRARAASLLVGIVAGHSACSGGSPSVTPSLEIHDAGAEVAKHDIPTACAEGEKKTCLLDAAYVDALCSAEYPDVALHLFAKPSPAARFFLKNDTESWDASGGRSHRSKLLFGEEVIILRKRTPKNAIIVGQGATFDVLRWNGACVSLMEEEVGPVRLGPPKKAPIVPWHKLEDATKAALRSLPKVKDLDEKATATCDDEKTKASCEKAEMAREQAIVDAIRDGKIELPLPSKRP